MKTKKFSKLALLNRGEPAVRFLQAIQEVNRLENANIQTYFLYTDPDKNSLAIHRCDVPVYLGPPFFQNGTERKSSYLNYSKIRQILLDYKIDGVWVGWGFAAEDPNFAALCEELGVTFIGPSSQTMRMLGDKILSKKLAEQAKIPVIPWSGGVVQTLEEAMATAKKLGYPLALKASAGGGGRGIRKVQKEKELKELFHSAQQEALKAFGCGDLFLEALIPSPRHIEVQIAADLYGNCQALGVRDCSVQRRHQKIIEETPSPVLSPKLEKQVCQYAVKLAKTAKYHNLGTVEFLFKDGKFYFMEMNTRLQVEHPITELTYGLDLVKLQISIARGKKLPAPFPSPKGHAIEVRLNAEDPEQGFAPAPGKVLHYSPPTGIGIRVDTGLRIGDSIPQEFDSMIAKIIAYGANRNEAIARLDRALREMNMIIEGGTTNKGFLLELIRNRAFVQAKITTDWLDKRQKRSPIFPKKNTQLALLCTGIEIYERRFDKIKERFFQTAFRGRPNLDFPQHPQEITLQHEKKTYKFSIAKIDLYTYRIYSTTKQWTDVIYRKVNPFQAELLYLNKRYTIFHSWQKHLDYVEVDGIHYLIREDTGGAITSPMPALVLNIAVQEGQRIKAGDKVAVLEAMKMEMPIFASEDGVVKKVMIQPGSQIAAGEAILLLETTGKENSPNTTLELKPLHSLNDLSHVSTILEELKHLFLGYDFPESYVNTALKKLINSNLPPQPQTEILAKFKEILKIYTSLEDLFQTSPQNAQRRHFSSKEYLYLYLHWFSGEGEGLPEEFLTKLKNALSCYKIESLKPQDRLKNAILRIFLSNTRLKLKNQVLKSLLKLLLEHPHWLQPADRREFRLLITNVAEIAQKSFPELYNICRRVLYALFDGRYMERRRQKILYKVDLMLDKLANSPSDSERASQMAWLLNVPISLKKYLSQKIINSPQLAPHILEIFVRRLYQKHYLKELYTITSKKLSQCVAQIKEDSQPIHLTFLHKNYRQFSEACRDLSDLLTRLNAKQAIGDILLTSRTKISRNQELEFLNTSLQSFSPPPSLQRLSVLIYSPKNQDIHIYTFRHNSSKKSWQEVEYLRDIHPTLNQKLELWRFGHFQLERLPSKDEIYLFKGISKIHAHDQRLFAIAQIRDFAPVRNERGEIVQLPHLEYIILEALDAIREELAHRKDPKTLNWNRLIFYLLPPILISKKNIEALARRLWPLAKGLDLEKVVFRIKLREKPEEIPQDTIVQIKPSGQDMVVVYKIPDNSLIKPMNDYSMKVLWAKQRGLVYAYELVKMLTPQASTGELPPGQFQEYDLVDGVFQPVQREYGQNHANVVVGTICNFTSKYPEGMTRVLIVGDCTRSMGSLAEPECSRILAALDLAEEKRLPVEWYAVSSGAKISMDSGTENLDWTAKVLKRIIEFTQKGGIINIIVDAINVGAQSYWNAEATMLMHTKGCLIMTPNGAMVLTGKNALDYSGGVSAEDNLGIGGYERIMGPNAQAHYYAQNLMEAYKILFEFYDYTYILPGEKLPRLRKTTDPWDRDICRSPYRDREGGDFQTVGDIFSQKKNAERKKPFSIREVMRALQDTDASALERWAAMKDGELAVVLDTHIGGVPACMIGIESKPLERFGYVPSYGPEVWTGGTLFPKSSKKVARAINSASGNRAVVVLANLSGFDGSPESLRKLQLEYGAEIGRAVVNYQGPALIFCVISRYHGGAYVVFSRFLNPYFTSLALEGSFASVIGGAPAAYVVFPRKVKALVMQNKRLNQLKERWKKASNKQRAILRQKYDELYQQLYQKALRQVAEEFDQIHTVERAKKVGSLDRIFAPKNLRKCIIEILHQKISNYQKNTK
ncbi:MAG: ATP-grasp domain-containing protein [Planctomycetota bacterium]|nr:MAG: ATP-grasp domain-containing protein [Planctomycetota bacterium]